MHTVRAALRKFLSGMNIAECVRLYVATALLFSRAALSPNSLRTNSPSVLHAQTELHDLPACAHAHACTNTILHPR